MVAENLQRPEDLPQYWLDAAQLPRRRGQTTDGWAPGCSRCRAPTSPRTAGATPSTRSRPGLIDRPVRRPRADPLRLAAVGRPAQRLRPAPPGGHARPRRRSRRSPGFMGVGDIALRDDLQYERYNLARPRQTWALFRAGARRPRRWRRSAAPPRTCPTRRSRCRTSSSWPPRPTCPTRRRSRCSRSSDPVGIFRADPRRPRPCSWPATATAWSTWRPPGSSTAPRRSCTRPRSPATATAWTASSTARRGARAHRLQPPGRAALEHGAGERRLHRAGRRGAARATTRPTTACPLFPDAGDDAATVAEHRGGVHARATRLRQPDHVHARGPGRRTRSTATVARRGRSARSPPVAGRAHRAHLRPAPHHRPHHGPAVRQRRAEPLDHPGAAALRRRRPGRRRPRRRVPERAGRGRSTSTGARSARSRSRSSTTTSAPRDRYDGLSPRRLRRHPPRATATAASTR